MQRYQDMTESALSDPDFTIQGVDATLIAKFTEAYGDTAFMCRYRRCPRSTDGFETAKKRQKHEFLHTKRLKCADATCEFYISGFSTKSALQAHNRRYHAKAPSAAVPTLEICRIQESSPREQLYKAMEMVLNVIKAMPMAQPFLYAANRPDNPDYYAGMNDIISGSSSTFANIN